MGTKAEKAQTVDLDTIKIVDAAGVEVKVRQMTRGMVKELRKAGLDPTTVSKSENPGAHTEEVIDWLMANVYPDINTDEMANFMVMELGTRTIRASYGTGESIKNS